MTKAGFWLNAVLAGAGIAAFAVASGVFGYKWLALDEPNRSYHCGSGSRGGVCFSGENVNIVLTLLFGALAVAGIVLCARYARRPPPE